MMMSWMLKRTRTTRRGAGVWRKGDGRGENKETEEEKKRRRSRNMMIIYGLQLFEYNYKNNDYSENKFISLPG